MTPGAAQRPRLRPPVALRDESADHRLDSTRPSFPLKARCSAPPMPWCGSANRSTETPQCARSRRRKSAVSSHCPGRLPLRLYLGRHAGLSALGQSSSRASIAPIRRVRRRLARTAGHAHGRRRCWRAPEPRCRTRICVGKSVLASQFIAHNAHAVRGWCSCSKNGRIASSLAPSRWHGDGPHDRQRRARRVQLAGPAHQSSDESSTKCSAWSSACAPTAW